MRLSDVRWPDAASGCTPGPVDRRLAAPLSPPQGADGSVIDVIVRTTSGTHGGVDAAMEAIRTSRGRSA